MNIKYHLVSIWSSENGHTHMLVPVDAIEDSKRAEAKESFRVDMYGLFREAGVNNTCRIAIGK